MAESSGGVTATHIYEDYTRQKVGWNKVFTNEDEIKTFITAKRQAKLFASADKYGLSVTTPSFSQKLIGTEVYKIVLDCDDDAPNKESMDEQTETIIEWAKTELAEALEVKAEDLAIHVSSREVGGVFKVSVGIVVTTLKCVLKDQWKYLTDLDSKSFLDSTPKPLGSKACIIDHKIYRTGQLRMPNCHKPGEDPAGIKKPVTFTKNPIAHMPSCQMIKSGLRQAVKVKLVAPDESEEEGEDEEEEEESDISDDENEGMRSSLDFTADDVKTMLNLIDPDVGYDGYFAVACFLRNYCRSGKKLFMDWMKNLKDSDHQHRIAKASAFFDGRDGYTGYTFRSLVYYAEKDHPAEVSEWRCQSLLYMDPWYISAHDYAQLMVTKMPALKFCQNDWYIYDPETGTWKEIQVSLLKHKAKVLLMPEIDAVILKVKDELQTAVSEKKKKQISYLKSKIKAWKKQKYNLGMSLNGTVVDHLKMPGIVENEIRWNDNDDGQMIWIVPFENGCIDMRESYPMEL
eukprot:SAG11_NODE_3789_length_2224_cov_2.889412_2_plen_514_part_01